MSYARFGADGSDVYVFTSSRALECCGCVLQKREWVDDPTRSRGYMKHVGEIIEDEFDSNAGMIEHLERHVAAGHEVPDHTFARLRDPEDAAENQRTWVKYRDEP